MSRAKDLVRAAIQRGDVFAGFDIDTSATAVLSGAVVRDFLRHRFLMRGTCVGCRWQSVSVSGSQPGIKAAGEFCTCGLDDD